MITTTGSTLPSAPRSRRIRPRSGVPATTDPNVPTGLVPEYTQIDFQNFAEGGGWVNTGQTIYVYPVVTFPTDPSQPYAQAHSQPAQRIGRAPRRTRRESAHAARRDRLQYFRSQVQYVDFAGGAGFAT